MSSTGKEKSPNEDLILKAVSDLGQRFDKVEHGLQKIDQNVQAQGKKLAVVCSEVDKLDNKVKSLEIENESLKIEMKRLKSKETLLEERLDGLEKKVDITYQKTNDVEQYTRRENLRVYGISEAEAENGDTKAIETSEQCLQKVLALLNAKLKLARKIHFFDLAAVHRIGTYDKKSSKPRSIIIRFVSRRIRDMVFDAKAGLKGSKYVITEDLTPYQYRLLMKTKNESTICDKVWTKYGKIHMLAQSGKYVQINSFSDLTDPLNRSKWGSVPNRKRDFNNVEKSPEEVSNSPDGIPPLEGDQVQNNEGSQKCIGNITNKKADRDEGMDQSEAPIIHDLDTKGQSLVPIHSEINMKIQTEKSKSLLDTVDITDIETPNRKKREKKRSKIPERTGIRGRLGSRGRFCTRPSRTGLFNYFMTLDSDTESKCSDDVKDD